MPQAHPKSIHFTQRVDVRKRRCAEHVAQMVSWLVLPIDLVSNSCEIADFGRLQAVSRDWRICFELIPLEAEPGHVEHTILGLCVNYEISPKIQRFFDDAPLMLIGPSRVTLRWTCSLCDKEMPLEKFMVIWAKDTAVLQFQR